MRSISIYKQISLHRISLSRSGVKSKSSLTAQIDFHSNYHSLHCSPFPGSSASTSLANFTHLKYHSAPSILTRQLNEKSTNYLLHSCSESQFERILKEEYSIPLRERFPSQKAMKRRHKRAHQPKKSRSGVSDRGNELAKLRITHWN